ncbi:MAG: hypothetical protein AAGB22_04540, partial [Bacteroidota bacterium]
NVWFRSDRLVMIGFKSGARINRKDVTDLYRCIKEEHGSDKMSVVMDLKSALYITRNARLHLTEEDWLGMTVALALVVNHADNRWVTELLQETAMPSQAFETEEEATVWAKRSLRMVA